MSFRRNLGAGAALLALSSCTSEGGRTLQVAGDYKPLSTCLRAELARNEPSILVCDRRAGAASPNLA
jgi:hypothetical protein